MSEGQTKTIGEQADVLGQLFDRVITTKYGNKRAPEPLIMPTGITHLDSLLGGGLVSSGPIMISSTPESGKSTYAFQMSGKFHQMYENGIIVFLDIEGSGSSQESSEYKVSRVETFGLANSNRFRYEPVVLNVVELFGLIDELITQKRVVEQKTGREFFVMIVWDSVASTRSSKADEALDHNKLIGYKARELSFYLDKMLPLFKFNRIFFLCIDQIRAKMTIEGQGRFTPKERSVGEFKNMQAASNIFSLQHNIQQWLFLSRGATISPSSGMGIDGWELNVFTEKNKLAPSQHSVTCVFDMYHGIDKFWSEFTFLSKKTPSERKIYGDKKLPYKFMIDKASKQKYHLKVYNPDDPDIEYTSAPFFKKEAKKMYANDVEFKQWFDYAIQVSSYYRITAGILQFEMDDEEIYGDTPGVDFDPETGAYYGYDLGEAEQTEPPEVVDVQPEESNEQDESESVEQDAQQYDSIF